MAYEQLKLSVKAIKTGILNASVNSSFFGGFYNFQVATFTGSEYAYIGATGGFAEALSDLAFILAPELLLEFFGDALVVAIVEAIDKDGDPPLTAPGGTMPYTPGDFDREHVGLTFGGLLPGSEIWVCSVKLASASSGIAGDAADLILESFNLHDWMEDALAPAVKTYFQAQATGISNAAWLTFAKVSRYGKNGKLRSNDPGEVYEHVFPAGTTGGSTGGVQHPNQVALAVSLTTDYTRGPGHKGRFYLPMPTAPVGTDGLIDVGFAMNVENATKTFLEAISDVPGPDVAGSPGAAVMSRKSGAAVTRKVTGVSVGRALDTVRRRRNKLAENYVSIAVDQGAF